MLKQLNIKNIKK